MAVVLRTEIGSLQYAVCKPFLTPTVAVAPRTASAPRFRENPAHGAYQGCACVPYHVPLTTAPAQSCLTAHTCTSSLILLVYVDTSDSSLLTVFKLP